MDVDGRSQADADVMPRVRIDDLDAVAGLSVLANQLVGPAHREFSEIYFDHVA